MVCLMVRWLFLGSLIFGIAHAAPLTFRAVAANLTSDNKQTYSPDNLWGQSPQRNISN